MFFFFYLLLCFKISLNCLLNKIKFCLFLFINASIAQAHKYCIKNKLLIISKRETLTLVLIIYIFKYIKRSPEKYREWTDYFYGFVNNKNDYLLKS